MNSEELLARLVAFDTTSTRSNLELIDLVRNLLDDHDISASLVHNDDRTRANLYATVGPDNVGGVMLSGHTDVVPTAGQEWHSDPYRLTTDDGLLIGRGACDMKGFIACVLAALPQMTAAALQTPIHLAFSYDEEIGCIGARRLVESMAGFEVRPRIGLIGEPTSMNMVLGHKGKVSFRVTVSGLSCHSAYISNGVNAVEYAAELIAFIRGMNDRAFRVIFEEIFGKALRKEAIVLDTRFNGGGNLDEALTVFLSGEVFMRAVPRVESGDASQSLGMMLISSMSNIGLPVWFAIVSSNRLRSPGRTGSGFISSANPRPALAPVV